MDENSNDSNHDSLSQADKFREAARELETDNDEKRFDETLKKLAKQKPKDDEPE
ncbi:hypothetical protein [Pararhizobium sp. IMCC21322]|uniref:hypothetical protein n=1 Tax=Pararhizobium sp. IMCC21322 TaxID=3067903 RepID=UPI002741CF52|nr:hypothetical protein [Pararhizobium sp. IMCC21322]